MKLKHFKATIEKLGLNPRINVIPTIYHGNIYEVKVSWLSEYNNDMSGMFISKSTGSRSSRLNGLLIEIIEGVTEAGFFEEYENSKDQTLRWDPETNTTYVVEE